MSESKITWPTAGLSMDILDKVRSYEGQPEADMQPIQTNDHVVMSDRLAGWMPTHLIKEDRLQDVATTLAKAGHHGIMHKDITTYSNGSATAWNPRTNNYHTVHKDGSVKTHQTHIDALKSIKEETELTEIFADQIATTSTDREDKAWLQRFKKSQKAKKAMTKVSTSKKIGHSISDVGAGGKLMNTKTYSEEVELEEMSGQDIVKAHMERLSPEQRITFRKHLENSRKKGLPLAASIMNAKTGVGMKEEISPKLPIYSVMRTDPEGNVSSESSHPTRKKAETAKKYLDKNLSHLGKYHILQFGYSKEQTELAEGWNDHVSKVVVSHHGPKGAAVTVHLDDGKKTIVHHHSVSVARKYAKQVHIATGKECEFEDHTQ